MSALENAKTYTGKNLETIFFRPMLSGPSAIDLGVRVLYNMPVPTTVQMWEPKTDILQKFTAAGWSGGAGSKKLQKTIPLNRVKAVMLSMVAVMLPRAGVAADRIDEVIKTPAAIHDPAAPKALPEGGTKGVVAFNDVSFRYPGSDEDALEHISFTAKPGQTTAIIGSTGCGKSTLLNLIPRFYDVSEGSVTIDGVDVRDMSQAQLHDQLGYVPQKGVLFSGTIDSNLKFGGDHITDADVRRAAEIAQAAEFISAKPEGYNAPIAQGGSNVSGGQKQRLSIARAIAKHPQIYLFDDSFSALDYKTDVALRRALKAQTDNATVIIVAQRISTVLHANQILVLDEGRIVGKGTHAQLMESCPEYQEIARSQLSQKELNLQKEGE